MRNAFSSLFLYQAPNAISELADDRTCLQTQGKISFPRGLWETRSGTESIPGGHGETQQQRLVHVYSQQSHPPKGSTHSIWQGCHQRGCSSPALPITPRPPEGQSHGSSDSPTPSTTPITIKAPGWAKKKRCLTWKELNTWILKENIRLASDCHKHGASVKPATLQTPSTFLLICITCIFYMDACLIKMKSHRGTFVSHFITFPWLLATDMATAKGKFTKASSDFSYHEWTFFTLRLQTFAVPTTSSASLS